MSNTFFQGSKSHLRLLVTDLSAKPTEAANLRRDVSNSCALSFLNPRLKFLFCGHYSIYKDFFTALEFSIIRLSNIWTPYMKVSNNRRHLENLNTAFNDYPNRS